MTSYPSSRDWDGIDWRKIPSADAANWIAVLPLAATEQHGPHLPPTTDVLIAEAFLERVRALLPATCPAIFLPVQPVGISTEHTSFPETLTLPPHDAIDAWMALGDTVAKTGLKKFVMVTSHGGNSAAMTIVAQELRARHDMLAVSAGWHRFGTPPDIFPNDEIRHGIHGGAVETAIMLARYPDLVRQDAIAEFPSAVAGMDKQFRWLSASRPAPFAWMAQDLHPSGAVGNASLATGAKGNALLDHGARAFCELLADVQAFDPARLSGNAVKKPD